jgi:hypothetical protein
MTLCQGEKGGQSLSSSMDYKKQKRGLYVKKKFWKIFQKIGVFIVN